MIDGFGNNNPGRGRYEQRPSAWDMLHPGRMWADRLLGEAQSTDYLLSLIEAHLREQDFRQERDQPARGALS